ncbi:hypothetical protein, partial [Duganella vulcania]|uniref:hypothetical protein n=1 Tax=Duganella vulcania TaxID=2692166 RepID=UPI001C2CF6A3
MLHDPRLFDCEVAGASQNRAPDFLCGRPATGNIAHQTNTAPGHIGAQGDRMDKHHRGGRAVPLLAALALAATAAATGAS